MYRVSFVAALRGPGAKQWSAAFKAKLHASWPPFSPACLLAPPPPHPDRPAPELPELDFVLSSSLHPNPSAAPNRLPAH